MKASLFKMKYMIILVCCLGVRGAEVKPSMDPNITYQDKVVTNKENFVRPCASLKDMKCIRNFFTRNSDCKATYGPPPDPLYLPQNTVYFPYVNMTNILAENTVTGLSNAKVVEFYYNKKTNNLVFAIEVRNLNETIQKSIYRYRRTGKETIVLTDFATVLFKKLIFTAIIPKIDCKLRLDLAEIHADIRENYPAFYIGPKSHASNDPDVKAAFKQFVKHWPMLLREGIFTQVPLFTSLFIQKTICDFGIKLKSV